jgi:hypothetical protein
MRGVLADPGHGHIDPLLRLPRKHRVQRAIYRIHRLIVPVSLPSQAPHHKRLQTAFAFGLCVMAERARPEALVQYLLRLGGYPRDERELGHLHVLVDCRQRPGRTTQTVDVEIE